MLNKNYFTSVMIVISTIILCTSCATEYDETNSIDKIRHDSYDKYMEYKQKPIQSVLEVALNGTHFSRSDEYTLGLTEEDANYLLSLDVEELLDLKSQLMEKWGLESDENIEDILEQSYDRFCQDLSDEELIDFNNFVDAYIFMPEGYETIEQFVLLQSNSHSDAYINACICAAVSIDNFGRILYRTLKESRASVEDCKKLFAAHLTETSINGMAGMLVGAVIPGFGWLVTATVICDAITAGVNYYNCVK